ncbi:MAG: tetratricopeptide repeat protein [Gemmatimonadota bacterium]
MTDMSAERWRRIQALLDDALDLAPDAVGPFLDARCGDDAELRAAVDRLLRAHERSEGFLDSPAAEFAAPLLASEIDRDGGRGERDAHAADPTATVAAGARIGAYRIVRELGRGGMGTVFLAERADGQFEHRVALKLVRRAFAAAAAADDDGARRFVEERRILASLNHPAIARLYDGGVTDVGSPYFVMEYVEGVRIDRYADRRGLGVEDRLRLFLQVCDAVQYAHRSLVVHRDLKPSNILVTEDGTVKLLDFGIAKVLEAGEGADGTDRPDGAAAPVPAAAGGDRGRRGAVDAGTRTGLRPMTPAYASPEQVRGEPVSTASDVYALGALLYALLTGRSPHRITGRSARDVERAVLEDTPAPPSVAVTESGEDADRARLARRLRGDLDAIVLEALRKEPERRYGTVERLAADVRRHLAGLPVTARADSRLYRIRKFVRRHRVAVGTAALFVLALAGFSAVTAAQASWIRVQAEELAVERDRAEEVSDFLVEIFGASDPGQARGDTITALALLERAAERIERELADQPRRRADLLAVMGRVYRNLGRYDRAEPLVASALALRRETVGPGHPDVAESLNDLGVLAIYRGRPDEAERLIREALELHRAADDEPGEALATTLNNLGGVLHQRGELDAAEPFYREAVEIRRRLLGDEHPDLATNLENLGGLVEQRGDPAGADTLYRAALEIRRRALGDDHPDVARSLNSLGALEIRRGRPSDGVPYLREAVEIGRRVLGSEHPSLAQWLNNLAAAHERAGDLDVAEPLYRESLAMKRALLGEDHPSVATSLNNLGLILRARGDLDEAEPLLTRSLEVRRTVYGDRHPTVATALNNLGALAADRGRLAEAESYYRDALALREALLPDTHPNVATSALGLGTVLLDRGEPTAAEPLLRRAVEIRRTAFDPGHWRTADAEVALGAALSALGRTAEADSLLMAGYDALRTARGDDDPRTREARERLDRHRRAT